MMRGVRGVAALAIALALAGVGSAAAHVGPSVRENNRYLKLTLLGDRVRLLYTYYLGEVPGAQARARLDGNRDGALSDDELEPFRDEIAAAVGGNLRAQLDGAPIDVTWDRVDVGIGTPSVAAGAFSVDLVAWLCLPATPIGAHELVLFDRFEPPQPGETELRIETAPGVSVAKSTFGPDGPVSQLHFRWIGGAGPLATEGLYVGYDIDGAAAPGGQRCGAEATAATAETPSRWPWLAALAAASLAAVLSLIVRRCRKRP